MVGLILACGWIQASQVVSVYGMLFLCHYHGTLISNDFLRALRTPNVFNLFGIVIRLDKYSLCARPCFLSQHDMCWPTRKREASLSGLGERKYIIYCHVGLGLRGIQALDIERERKAFCVSGLCNNKKDWCCSVADNSASIGPCPYYPGCEACLHWLWNYFCCGWAALVALEGGCAYSYFLTCSSFWYFFVV